MISRLRKNASLIRLCSDNSELIEIIKAEGEPLIPRLWNGTISQLNQFEQEATDYAQQAESEGKDVYYYPGSYFTRGLITKDGTQMYVWFSDRIGHADGEAFTGSNGDQMIINKNDRYIEIYAPEDQLNKFKKILPEWKLTSSFEGSTPTYTNEDNEDLDDL